MLKKITVNLCFLFLFSLPLFAQGSFDLIRVDTKGKGKNLEILAETAKPLTDRVGYDNQPNFINDQNWFFRQLMIKEITTLFSIIFQRRTSPILPKLLIEANIPHPLRTVSNT